MSIPWYITQPLVSECCCRFPYHQTNPPFWPCLHWPWYGTHCIGQVQYQGLVICRGKENICVPSLSCSQQHWPLLLIGNTLGHKSMSHLLPFSDVSDENYSQWQCDSPPPPFTYINISKMVNYKQEYLLSEWPPGHWTPKHAGHLLWSNWAAWVVDGFNQVSSEFSIRGSKAGGVGLGTCWAATICVSSIVLLIHWWISLWRQSYHWAAALNDLWKGSVIGSPLTWMWVDI